jgi:hypothetical protein
MKWTAADNVNMKTNVGNTIKTALNWPPVDATNATAIN